MGGVPANQLLPVCSLRYLYAKAASESCCQTSSILSSEDTRVSELSSKEKQKAITLKKKEQQEPRRLYSFLSLLEMTICSSSSLHLPCNAKPGKSACVCAPA